MSAGAPTMVAGVEVLVAGRALADELARRIVEVRVDDNLMLPDAFLIRVADPELKTVDSGPFQIGAEVEVRLAGSEARSLTSVIKGQITTLEPEFVGAGATICARGYDHSHALHRVPRTQTYQQMTFADIVRRVARRAGVQTGTVQDAGGVHQFVQQSQETDWTFLWRLASAIDFEVAVADRKLHFRPAGRTGHPPVALTWGRNLVAFRPRITGIQQFDRVVVRGWDVTRQAAIEATANSPKPDSRPRLDRAQVAAALAGGVLTVGDRPVTSQAEADALAASVAAQLANAAVEAEGTAHGDTALRSGTQVDIGGVGRFGGVHTISSSSHIVRGAQGYRTDFVVSGRAPRSLLDLMAPASPRRWEGPVAVGVVTQNEDPDGLGRVRVKYPALAADTEGWWARVTTPAAGDHRGLLMLPVPGEEVVVAWEHGDLRRPIVLGSVFGGAQRPGGLAHKDGSLAIRSDKRATIAAHEDLALTSEDKTVTVTAKGDVAVNSDASFTVKAQGDVKEQASGAVNVAGREVTIDAQGGSVTITGASQLELKTGGASIRMSASGTVQVSGTQISLG